MGEPEGKSTNLLSSALFIPSSFLSIYHLDSAFYLQWLRNALRMYISVYPDHVVV